MGLYFSREFTSNDLPTLRDAYLCYYKEEGIRNDWGGSAKRYTCILPRTLDERAAPEPTVQEESDFITCISISNENRLYLKDAILALADDSSLDFMEKCLPDYRLRAEIKVSGWSSLNNGLCVGVMTMGSKYLGAIIQVHTDMPPDLLATFTPVSGDIFSFLLSKLQSTSTL